MIGNLLKKQHIGFLLSICITALLSANPQVQLNVSISKTSISLDENITFEITLKGINNTSHPKLILPELKNNFSILSSNESTFLSIVNGKASRTKSYKYILRPFKTGKIILNPTKVTYNKKTYTSEPISIIIKENEPSPQTTTSSSPTKRTSSSSNKSIQNVAKKYNIFAQAIAIVRIFFFFNS